MQALAERVREKWSSHEDSPQSLLPPTATTPIDLTDDSPPLSLSQGTHTHTHTYTHARDTHARPTRCLKPYGLVLGGGADEVKTWLRRSYDAYLHALSAFARPKGLPREEGAADQEAEQKLGADRMLLRSFGLYRLAHTHTQAIPGEADGWTANQVASFCQKAFKVPPPPPFSAEIRIMQVGGGFLRGLRHSPRTQTRPPRKVGMEDEEARDHSNRQRAHPSDHHRHRQQQQQRQDDHSLLDESLDVSQGPPLLVPPTPDLPRPADLRKKAARRPKPTFPDLPPLPPFRAPPAASSAVATTDS